MKRTPLKERELLILNLLSDGATTTVDDMSRRLNLTPNQVRTTLPLLLAAGAIYCQRTGPTTYLYSRRLT